ncbi:MAG: hypothetical protein JW878_06110 [Methanomicrobia archaeon]|nr:hypothetical protein [Methanomicrobia archaeon]
MKRKLVADENAQALSIDFLVAIGIFIGAFLLTYYLLAASTASYSGESAKIYPVAHRVAEILIKDPGEPADWDALWIEGNYSAVVRIGLSDQSKPNVLDRAKLDALMSSNTSGNNTWWEFGEDAVGSTKYRSATAALGLQGNASGGYRGYGCYIQVIPTNESTFSQDVADDNFDAVRKGLSGDVVVIERIVVVPIIRDMDYDYDYYTMRMLVW